MGNSFSYQENMCLQYAVCYQYEEEGMRNFKSEVIRFAVWMRNGVAFCTTWFLILILAYHSIFHIQNISTNDFGPAIQCCHDSDIYVNY